MVAQLMYRVGHQSDVGRSRKENQDSYLILGSPALPHNLDLLLAVMDGMGGHRSGEVASAFVAEHLEEQFIANGYQGKVTYDPQHPDYYAVVLKFVLEQINEALWAHATTQPELQGMGTTASVALVIGTRLFIGHVGDSRIYLIRDGAAHQLTEDHSWVAAQVRAGALTPDEAAHHEWRSRLLRAVGLGLMVQVDRSILDLNTGDRVLLCSDGLVNYLSVAELAQAAEKYTGPQEACQWLVNLANQRGGQDNITVLMASFQGADTASDTGLPASGRVRGPKREGNAAAITQRILRQRRLPPSTTITQARHVLLQIALFILFGLTLGAITWAVMVNRSDLVSYLEPYANLVVPALVVCASLLGNVLGFWRGRSRKTKPAETSPPPADKKGP